MKDITKTTTKIQQKILHNNITNALVLNIINHFLKNLRNSIGRYIIQITRRLITNSDINTFRILGIYMSDYYDPHYECNPHSWEVSSRPSFTRSPTLQATLSSYLLRSSNNTYLSDYLLTLYMYRTVLTKQNSARPFVRRTAICCDCGHTT